MKSTATSLQFSLRSVGLVGPGLLDWASARELLANPGQWQNAPTVLPVPQRLPPAERRRAGNIVKLALAVADQACSAAAIDPQTLATVFSASTGDANNCHILCDSLSAAEPIVSPTRFTNSVHNAAAGYWHIATRSQAPSTSLCAFDASFAAGLLEAAVQCLSAKRPVLLVATDVPYPEPLFSMRPAGDAFGIALLLGPDFAAGDLARASLQIGGDEPVTGCGHAGLDEIRLGMPAARGLPLLQALARRQASTLYVEYLEGLNLRLTLSPAGEP